MDTYKYVDEYINGILYWVLYVDCEKYRKYVGQFHYGEEGEQLAKEWVEFKNSNK